MVAKVVSKRCCYPTNRISITALPCIAFPSAFAFSHQQRSRICFRYTLVLSVMDARLYVRRLLQCLFPFVSVRTRSHASCSSLADRPIECLTNGSVLSDIIRTPKPTTTTTKGDNADADAQQKLEMRKMIGVKPNPPISLYILGRERRAGLDCIRPFHVERWRYSGKDCRSAQS